MENNARYLECCAAGERSGLYYTCINSYLTADEVAYIVNNSESKVLIFSEDEARGRDRGAEAVPDVEVALCDGPVTESQILSLDEATRAALERRSRMNGSARDALFVGHHRSTEGHLGRCPTGRPAALPLFDFLRTCGSTARA